MPLRNVRGLLRMQAATSSIPTPNTGQVSILQTIRLGRGGGKSQEYEEQQCRHSASASNGCEQTKTERPARRNTGIWKLAERGFSGSLSSDRLTEGQENEIAENIYDWWISEKSYKQWYAERFQQLKIDFGEES